MAVTNEPAPHTIPWGLEWQQHLARQQNNASLSEVIGDGSTLEGDLTTVEGVVAALVAQIPAIGTPVTLTTQTEVDFAIPSWATVIGMTFSGLSISGTDNIMVRFGDAGGIEASGYLGAGIEIATAGNAAAALTTGMGLSVSVTAGDFQHGVFIAVKQSASANTWVGFWVVGRTLAAVTLGGSAKSLSDTLTTIRLTVSGTDTLDAGVVNGFYW
jgi:hypothetical protein